MFVLVEGFDRDAIAVAAFLASEGCDVRLSGPGEIEPGRRAALERFGVAVESGRNLDRDPGAADIAYLDVWTPEVARRVERLRAQGTRISCLAELLLERWPGLTIGITGTAGKTTTTSLVASILRTAGMDVAVSVGARAGNLWPTGELLDALVGESVETRRVLLLELTSSHLAFMRSSPTIAAIVSFWPDHVELHGNLDRYRAAKATIAAEQRVDDTLVLNADDASAGFAAEARGRVVEFSLERPVRHGAYRRSDSELVLVDDSGDEIVISLPLAEAAHPRNGIAAAAIAVAAGAPAGAIAAGIETAPRLPYRARPVGTLRGVPVIDDGMAATPAKTRALLGRYADRSIVLISGGTGDAGGGEVHAAPDERVLLEEACDEVARVAQAVVVFGPAGSRLAAMLSDRGVHVIVADALDAAVSAAACAVEDAEAIVFSPLFPVSLEDRFGFEALVARER